MTKHWRRTYRHGGGGCMCRRVLAHWEGRRRGHGRGRAGNGRGRQHLRLISVVTRTAANWDGAGYLEALLA